MKYIVFFVMILSSNLLAEDVWETVYHDDITLGTFMIRDMKAFNDNISAIGCNGIFLQSYNNGDSWQELYAGTDQELREICYINNSNIWICGDKGTLVKYNLKEKKFQDFSLNCNLNLYHICFTDSINGLLVTTNGKLLSTNNGGVNWDTIILHNVDQGYYTGWSQIKMKNKFEGYFISSIRTKGMGPKKESSFLYKTSDSGASWRLVAELPDENVTNIYLQDKDIWLTGTDGLLIKSKDNGKTWQWFNKDFNEFVLSMTLYKNDIYLGAGWYQSGLGILRSSDNMKTWELSLSSTEKDLIFTTLINNGYIFTALDSRKSILRKKLE